MSTSNVLIIQISTEELQELIEAAVNDALSKQRESDIRIEPETQYLTRADLARQFHVSLATINEWSRTGKIHRHYLGSRVFYLKSEIDDIFKTTTKLKSRYGNFNQK